MIDKQIERRTSPHLSESEVKDRLRQLDAATGQQRIDLITELAWRPAWAIRSRRGVLSQLRRKRKN